MPSMLKKSAIAVLTMSLASSGLAGAQQSSGDAELEKGIRQVRSAEFEEAVLTLDAVVRRLQPQKERGKELARAYTYLSIAYYGLSQETNAKAMFREAWKADPHMEIGASEFPPKYMKFLEGARKEAMSDVTPPPPATASTGTAVPKTASTATPTKKGGSKAVLLVLGGVALAGGGVALAAGGGGGSAASAPPPAPAPTTTTMPSITLTGTWRGPAPDGIIITSNVDCDLEYDLTLELAQTGTNLTGTWTVVIRKLNPNRSRKICDNRATTIGPIPLSGTVSAGTVSFSVTFQGEETVTLNFTGTFTATRMSGTWTCAAGCPQAGTWAANRS